MIVFYFCVVWCVLVVVVSCGGGGWCGGGVVWRGTSCFDCRSTYCLVLLRGGITWNHSMILKS